MEKRRGWLFGEKISNRGKGELDSAQPA